MIVSAFAALESNGGHRGLSMAMGKGDYDEAEKILGNSVALQIVISAVLTVRCCYCFGQTAVADVRSK